MVASNMLIKNQSRIKIILVDDHPLIRQAIRIWLEKDDDMKVMAEARDGKEALDIITYLRPDVVILDISMPKLNGLELTKQIASRFPQTRVLVFTVHSDNEHIQGMLQAGASGYLTKEISGEELVHAVRAVAAGEQVFCTPTNKEDENINENMSTQSTKLKNITQRELEILRFVANGYSNQDIALKIGISLRGVKGILTATYIKLGANSRTEAISIALKSGILSLGDLNNNTIV